jgi:hypothetical protein
MSMAAATDAAKDPAVGDDPTKPGPWNGHHWIKGSGDTMYTGPLENLPYPDGPVTDLAAAVEAMYTEGYVIFPGVLNPDEVALLRARMDAMGSQNDEDYVVPKWCYNKQIPSRYHENPDLLDYIDRPGVVDVAEAIHGGGEAYGCRVAGGSSWITGAGRAMGIHIDWMPVELPESVHEDPNVRVPILSSTAHFYLNDMVAELGPTTVIPGSHKAGRPPRGESTWRGVTPKAVMVKAGDVCLFRADLWHGAHKNTHPTERRYMLQVFYVNGALRTHYPPMTYESLWNPAVLAKATPRQRRLLGARD